MFTTVRNLPQLASPFHSRQRVGRLGSRRSSGRSLRGRLGTAVLAAVPIVAMSMALASPASADTQILTAAFGGDGDLRPSSVTTSERVPPRRGPEDSATTVTANTSTSSVGDLVVFTAIVRPAHNTGYPGAVSVPTGTVTFRVGATTLCTETVAIEHPTPRESIGKAKCKSSQVPVGTHVVTAKYSGNYYSGNGRFIASEGTTTTTVTVRKAPLDTATTVTADPPTSKKYYRVTYLATVRPVTGTANPGGTVTFTLKPSPSAPKGIRLCTADIPLNGVGKAKCKSTRTPVGTHTVIATYSGNAGFNTSSGSIDVTVSEPGTATGPTP